MTDNIVDMEAPYGRKKDGTPKRPNAWQQRGQGKVEPRGAAIGDTRGKGWGGPAKGAGNHGPGPGRMKEGPQRQEKLRSNAELRERAMMKIDELIDNELPGVALSASQAMLDRIEGKAIQRLAPAPNGETVEELRTINPRDLTPEQREALREAIMLEMARRIEGASDAN